VAKRARGTLDQIDGSLEKPPGVPLETEKKNVDGPEKNKERSAVYRRKRE